jgi:aminoglycoside phosphotransferase (APT) family kinase protein
MRQQLESFLQEWRGDESLTITDLSRISTGHSRAMYRVGCSTGDRFVVRVEQGGVFGTSGTEEYRVMQALHATGFPVARVRASEPTGTVLGNPFFVMDEIPGAIGADERRVDEPTCRAFVRLLSSLHDLDWQAAGIPFAQLPTADDATHRQIDRWRSVYREATPVPIPLLEDAAAWLHRHAPPLERLSVVHGDAGPGNFVHHDGEVVAVTDWEFAHLGDPNEDWVFCLTMRGATTMDRTAWLGLFREEAGVDLSTDTVRYWEAFNLFKGACANRTTLTLFETGANPAPNMAIIGTTLHQVFLRRLVDLVNA